VAIQEQHVRAARDVVVFIDRSSMIGSVLWASVLPAGSLIFVMKKRSMPSRKRYSVSLLPSPSKSKSSMSSS